MIVIFLLFYKSCFAFISAPVEKKSKRQKQREKLRAVKQGNTDKKTPTKKSSITSTNQLVLPQDQAKTKHYIPGADTAFYIFYLT